MAGCTPRFGITIAWGISLVLVLVAFIVACIAAARLQKKGGGNSQSAGFAAMWTAILLVVISIVGTVVLRRFRQAIPIGILLGVVFVMSQQMLILFVIFVEHSQLGNDSLIVKQSEQAMAAFSFFLFFVYGIFGIILGVHRFSVIEEDKPQSLSNSNTYYDDSESHDTPPIGN